MADDEAALTDAIVRLATRYGRYGYRRIREMLVAEGWRVNVKRVYRIWRREGLKVPIKQPKRSRLWPNDGSCVRLRPERPNHVWSYDFVQDRTQDGRAFRMLVVLDEFTRRCLAIVVARKLSGDATTILFHNAHLSMFLKGIDFADRDAIPWGVSGSVARDERFAESAAFPDLIG
jgi:hypothetical protein